MYLLWEYCGARRLSDMIIANGDDFHVIHRLLDGRNIGTLFVGHLDENFDLVDVLEEDR